MIAPSPDDKPDPSLFIRSAYPDDKSPLYDEQEEEEEELRKKAIMIEHMKTKNNDVIRSKLLKDKSLNNRQSSFLKKNNEKLSSSFISVKNDEKSNEKLTFMLDRYGSNVTDEGQIDKSNDYINDIRMSLKTFIMTSFVGRRYMNILLALSIFSCFQFIYQTYLDEDDETDKRILDFFGFLELLLAALFAFDWTLWLFLADHRLEQLLR